MPDGMMMERVGERGIQHEYIVKSADAGYVTDPQHAPDCELCRKEHEENLRGNPGQTEQPAAAD